MNRRLTRRWACLFVFVLCLFVFLHIIYNDFLLWTPHDYRLADVVKGFFRHRLGQFLFHFFYIYYKNVYPSSIATEYMTRARRSMDIDMLVQIVKSRFEGSTPHLHGSQRTKTSALVVHLLHKNCGFMEARYLKMKFTSKMKVIFKVP
jgi:hypothetical protein